MIMKIQVAAFWVVTPYSDVVGYNHFGGPCHINLVQDLYGFSIYLRVAIFSICVTYYYLNPV